jgi:hypothetical protein
LNLYGFSRASIPCIHEGKTKSYSYYSHPYFIRGDLSRLHHMVRCKIKGTGKKRGLDDDDDQDYNGNIIRGDHYKNASGIKNEECNIKSQVPMPAGKIDRPAMDSKDTLSDLEDGDLLFFDGIPFHFLSPQLDVASLKDTTGQVPDSDIDPLPLMLPPPMFPPLESDLDLLQVEDVLESNSSSSYCADPRRHPRSIILDDNYDRYCNSSELLQNSSLNIANDRPQPNDSTVLGVFDHHFYDIHSPGTTSMHRYCDLQTKTPTALTSNRNPTLMDSWTYFRHQKTHVPAK